MVQAAMTAMAAASAKETGVQETSAGQDGD